MIELYLPYGQFYEMADAWIRGKLGSWAGTKAIGFVPTGPGTYCYRIDVPIDRFQIPKSNWDWDLS